MGIFNFNSSNKISEKVYVENGYTIGVDSHKIYHVPKLESGCVFILPEGTRGITEQAISEMRSSRPAQIVVPGSFKSFNVQLPNFPELKKITLKDGVEAVKCSLDVRTAVDFELPTTIKRIGRNNYPIVRHLEIPEGVTEIDQFFASHDLYLLSVSIPGSIKTIPGGAFNQCKNLETVVINEGVENSEDHILRGTNNLRSLAIPSTYNGTIELSMEARGGSNSRGNSKYDPKNFHQEENNILNIKIKRGSNDFEFNIRRGDQPSIIIDQNSITFKFSRSQQIVSVDCSTLTPGVYDIKNGNITLKQEKNEKQESNRGASELDIMFSEAFKEHIVEEDFWDNGISDEEDIQKVISYMQSDFMNAVSQHITRTDGAWFTLLLNRAIAKFEKEKEKEQKQSKMDDNPQR